MICEIYRKHGHCKGDGWGGSTWVQPEGLDLREKREQGRFAGYLTGLLASIPCDWTGGVCLSLGPGRETLWRDGLWDSHKAFGRGRKTGASVLLELWVCGGEEILSLGNRERREGLEATYLVLWKGWPLKLYYSWACTQRACTSFYCSNTCSTMFTADLLIIASIATLTSQIYDLFFLLYIYTHACMHMQTCWVYSCSCVYLFQAGHLDNLPGILSQGKNDYSSLW